MSPDGHCPSLLRLARELEEPVARLGVSGWSAARLRVLLGRAEMRAWRIEDRLVGDDEAPETVFAQCPVDGARAMLAPARRAEVGLPAGAFVVAQSLPVGSGRWVLVGRPTVVAGEGVGKLERLLASLRAPRGEFWRVHGGVVARAARRCVEAAADRFVERTGAY